MNEILTWTLIIIAVGLTIQFVVLSLRHENLLREHTRAIRELTSNTRRSEPWDFTEKVKGIYKYVQIIAWICVFFCVAICVHYIVVFYPRFTTIDVHKAYYENLGVDYWGILVGFFTLLVTLLVGWQIYSTINARKELDSFKKETAEAFNRRIQHLEECCNEGRSEIASISKQMTTYTALYERVMLIMESEFAELYLFTIIPDSQIHRKEYHYLNHRIQAIIRASNIGDIAGCNIQTRATIESISNLKKIVLPKTMKRLLVDGILTVKNPQSIIDFDKLSELINGITEKQD